MAAPLEVGEIVIIHSLPEEHGLNDSECCVIGGLQVRQVLFRGEAREVQQYSIRLPDGRKFYCGMRHLRRKYEPETDGRMKTTWDKSAWKPKELR